MLLRFWNQNVVRLALLKIWQRENFTTSRFRPLTSNCKVNAFNLYKSYLGFGCGFSLVVVICAVWVQPCTNTLFWMQANSEKNSTALSSTVANVRVVMDSSLAQCIEKPTRTLESPHAHTRGPIWRYSGWTISNRDTTGRELRRACCLWKPKYITKL